MDFLCTEGRWVKIRGNKNQARGNSFRMILDSDGQFLMQRIRLRPGRLRLFACKQKSYFGKQQHSQTDKEIESACSGRNCYRIEEHKHGQEATSSRRLLVQAGGLGRPRQQGLGQVRGFERRRFFALQVRPFQGRRRSTLGKRFGGETV